MDAFYVSVELLERPDLRGMPVIVGPAIRDARGVVMTASYEARRFGVHSALPMTVARRRCPQAVVLPRNMDRYHEASKKVMAVMHRYSDLVEVVGMDEAYVDLSDSPAPKTRARQIKRDVLAETGLDLLDRARAEPADRQDRLRPRQARRALRAAPRALSRGRRRAAGPDHPRGRPANGAAARGTRDPERLRPRPRTREQPRGDPRANHARSLGRRACGFGGTEVAVERERKSESRERTFSSDQTDPTLMRREVAGMARTVAKHLGGQGIRGRTVTLKIRLAPFRTFTRSRTLAEPTADPAQVAAAAQALFDAFERDAPVRLLGVGVSNLVRDREHGEGPAPGGADAPAGTGPMQLPLG